jgi:hypothetical protein
MQRGRVFAQHPGMNSRLLIRIASMTTAAFLNDGHRERIERRRKAILQAWREERRARAVARNARTHAPSY